MVPESLQIRSHDRVTGPGVNTTKIPRFSGRGERIFVTNVGDMFLSFLRDVAMFGPAAYTTGQLFRAQGRTKQVSRRSSRGRSAEKPPQNRPRINLPAPWMRAQSRMLSRHQMVPGPTGRKRIDGCRHGHFFLQGPEKFTGNRGSKGVFVRPALAGRMRARICSGRVVREERERHALQKRLLACPKQIVQSCASFVQPEGSKSWKQQGTAQE